MSDVVGMTTSTCQKKRFVGVDFGGWILLELVHCGMPKALGSDQPNFVEAHIHTASVEHISEPIGIRRLLAHVDIALAGFKGSE